MGYFLVGQTFVERVRGKGIELHSRVRWVRAEGWSGLLWVFDTIFHFFHNMLKSRMIQAEFWCS